MAKYLANRLYITKKRLYTLLIEEGSFTVEHIHYFKIVTTDIEGIDVNTKDEDRQIMLLSFLLDFYEHFMDTLPYGK